MEQNLLIFKVGFGVRTSLQRKLCYVEVAALSSTLTQSTESNTFKDMRLHVAKWHRYGREGMAMLVRC